MRCGRDCVFLLTLLGSTCILWAMMFPSPVQPPCPTTTNPLGEPAAHDLVAQVQEAFAEDWYHEGVAQSSRATDLQIARRIALGLMGTIPSLEEIRLFEHQPEATRLQWYVEYVLADSRCHAYLAERLARTYVGVEEGPYVLFRRSRLVTWLQVQLKRNVPYDRIVQQLLADEGTWLDEPGTNFFTVTVANDPEVLGHDNLRGRVTRYADSLGIVAAPLINADRVTARVTRVFLGQRLDCAQCHDHPFASWTQADFQGLAAFFAHTKVGFQGVREQTQTAPQASVPFYPELLPREGTRRQRLATWVTHPQNRYFAAAMVNRMWALMFGRPLHDPIDQLPTYDRMGKVLRLLSDDFAQHYDLRRLIRLFVSLPSFVMASDAIDECAEECWASFPLSRLRAEQVATSILQATTVTTPGDQTHGLIRRRFAQQRQELIDHYGDLGESEMDDRQGTLSQRLLVMNSPLIERHLRRSFWNASTQIARFASPSHAIEVVYLCVLTRRPTTEEVAYFERQFKNPARPLQEHIEDLYWTLFNSTEAAWNH